MSNMSYCRFENTNYDLGDCMDHLHDNDLSPDEERARKRLIQKCKAVAAEFDDEE